MSGFVRDFWTNAPYWSAVFGAIAAISAAVFVVAYLCHRRNDQTQQMLRERDAEIVRLNDQIERKLGDRDREIDRLKDRNGELERDLTAAQSEHLKLQGANLQLQTDHLKYVRHLTDDSREDISIAYLSDDTGETTDEMDQVVNDSAPDV